jgi:hypothetical protein
MRGGDWRDGLKEEEVERLLVEREVVEREVVEREVVEREVVERLLLGHYIARRKGSILGCFYRLIVL